MKVATMHQKLHRYILDTFASKEEGFLEKMAKRADKAGMPRIMIAADQARFLQVFLPAIGAKLALDIGTLFGYSAAMMAEAMGPGGRVVSLEVEPDHATVAQENLDRLGLADRVEIQIGPALDRMKRFDSHVFDFVLIDADKQGYLDYFAEALRIVRPGGIIAADNALAFGRVADKPGRLGRAPEVKAIQRFNAHVAKDRRVDACLLPLGDGLLVARVKD